MELLEEYQQALKKIQELENKLTEYKDAFKVVDQGLDTVIDSLKQGIEHAHPDDEHERILVEEMFGVPMRVLEMNRIILSVPTMDKDAQQEAKQRVSKMVVEMLRDKLARMTKMCKE